MTNCALTSGRQYPSGLMRIQSPPVAAQELYSDQLAEVAGYDDEDDY